MNSHTYRLVRCREEIFRSCLMAVLLLPCIAFAQSPSAVNLSTSAAFAMLAHASVVNTCTTMINGDIGVDTAGTISGFPPGVFNGAMRRDCVSFMACADLATAYDDAASRTAGSIPISGNIGGRILFPGLYNSVRSCELSMGDLTLDARGDDNAVWIFQIDSNLTTACCVEVILLGGARAANIFWQVGANAIIGSFSIFYGTILATQSVELKTNATLIGRALSLRGSVICCENTVTVPGKRVSPLAKPSEPTRLVWLRATH